MSWYLPNYPCPMADLFSPMCGTKAGGLGYTATALYEMYFACADLGTSFHVECHQALGVVMYYIITKYLAGGIHAIMTLCVPLLDPTGPHKGQIPWHGTVLWLHAHQGVTPASKNFP